MAVSGDQPNREGQDPPQGLGLDNQVNPYEIFPNRQASACRSELVDKLKSVDCVKSASINMSILSNRQVSSNRLDIEA